MSNLAYKIQQKQYEEKQQQPSPSRLFKRRVTKGEKVLWAFAVVALLAASLYVVSTYASVYALNNDIQQLETKTEEQTKVNGMLEQKVSKLSTPERIFDIAKNKLGMTLKDNIKVLPGD